MPKRPLIVYDVKEISEMGRNMKISNQDKVLLRELQQDAGASLAQLADRCGMATSTVWRKVQEFEAAGLLVGRVAILDPKAAGAGLCVFATVRLKDHSEAAIAGFARVVSTQPHILEAHAISGGADYMLKIRCRDVEDYEVFMSQHLLRAGVVKSVESAFSLKALKFTTALPL